MKTAYKALLAAGVALAAREIWQQGKERSLDGEAVLITGGSRGLGLALAREFAAHGCRIALCARDPEELERARKDLQDHGADVAVFVCDITQPEQVEQMIAQAASRFGAVDILVNSAGIISVGPAQTMLLEDYQAAMDSDFWGQVYCTLAILPQMQARRRGRIINITSIGGKVSVPHLLPYSCAKFAATAFSEGLRAELAGDGITVTTIIPGLMRTGSYDQAAFKGKQAGEYGWFSAADNLPGLSISAERAAREIVRAARRGEAERTLSLPANLAARVQGLAPGFVSSILALVNQALPSPQPGAPISGRTAHEQHPSAIVETLTVLGRKAQKRLNQS